MALAVVMIFVGRENHELQPTVIVVDAGGPEARRGRARTGMCREASYA